MRPRIIGTRSILASGACLREERIEALGVGVRDVEEEEARRAFRQGAR